MSNGLDRFLDSEHVSDADFGIERLLKNREKLAQRASKLSAEAKLAEEDFQAVDQLVSALKQNQFAKIVKLQELMPKIYSRVSTSEPALEEIFKQVFLKAREECQRVARRYPALIQDACLEEGMSLDQTSTHPKYTFCDGFITLEINEKTFEAKAYTREGTLFVKPFDISLIISDIKREIDRIFRRPFKPIQVAKKLYSNYKSIIQKEEKHMGDQIPIRKITTRLGKNQKNFRTDEFIIDLSKLIESGAPVVYGYELDLGHTKDTRSGILLHRLESHGYIGFISFRKEEKT